MSQNPIQDHLDEKQFLLAVTELSESLAFGSDASVYLGSGVDYAQSRLYQPGDPVKSIDWRVTGRTGKIFVREFETLKQKSVYMVLDASGSMQVSSQKFSKYDWSVMIGGALALAALRQNMPAALLSAGEAFNGRNLQYAPSLSRSQVHQWMHLLRGGPSYVKKVDALSRTLRDLMVNAHDTSLIVVLSDLHEPDALYWLKQLAQTHEVLVLKMTDPAEHSVSGGIFRAQEAESGRSFLVNGKKSLTDSSQVLQELRRAGVDSLKIDTGSSFLPGLRAFLKERTSARQAS